VRGRTLKIEGFLVGKPFVDTVFDDFMRKAYGDQKWLPEALTPELVRPLQASYTRSLRPHTLEA
jgi:hypothetical protein